MYTYNIHVCTRIHVCVYVFVVVYSTKLKSYYIQGIFFLVSYFSHGTIAFGNLCRLADMNNKIVFCGLL